VPVREEGLNEVTADQPDRDEENAIETDELLVEEVSIDGMRGVYRRVP
jgi:mycofactocin precursor